MLSIILHPKCYKAISDAKASFHEWKCDCREAENACIMFEKRIKSIYGSVHKIKFVSYPISPYYFLNACIEREIHPTFVVNVNEGVVEKGMMDEMQKFAEYIDLISLLKSSTPASEPSGDDAGVALRCARMLYGFHANDTDILVNWSSDGDVSDRPVPKQPSLVRGEDGSVTLVYYLKRDGRSIAFRECRVHVDALNRMTLDGQCFDYRG